VRATADVATAGRLKWVQSVGFITLGVLLGLALIAATDAVYGLQGNAAAAVSVLPFGYAFAAGMVAAVNPCGVLLLPSLVAYYLGAERRSAQPWYERTTSAFFVGVMATLGFVVVFAAIGFVFAVGGRALGAYFPVGGIAVGLGLVTLGIWTVVSGRSIGLAGASRAMAGVRLGSSPRSLFLFGVGYGVASLACTLPVFLVVVGSALAAGGLLPAAGQFVVYALGMGTVVSAVVVGAAFFRAAVSGLLRGTLPYLPGVSASLLIGAGVYLVHYWLSALSF